MFIERVLENNRELVDFAFEAHQKGDILPDTYVLDLDTIVSNALSIKHEADHYGVRLYFMLKQIGRNPAVARELMRIGYDGCVAVDYREALLMIEHGIPLANVGHLEQIPAAAMLKILSSNPENVTVYSREKIREIDSICKQLGTVQSLLLKPLDEASELYPGQRGGFMVEELPEVLKLINDLDNVTMGGFTVFPALLFDPDLNEAAATANISAVRKALQLVDNCSSLNINLPSVSCSSTMKLIHSLGGNSAEPGHALTGTTPLHANSEQPERVGYVYVSEVSHNCGSKAYCFAGGHYRRSHMEKAIVGKNIEDSKVIRVVPPIDEAIDYHYELQENCEVGDSCIMCYRSQMFTTRSQIAVVRGLHNDNPKIIGLYSSLGEAVKNNWSK